MQEESCYRKNCSTAITLKVRSKLEKSDSSKEYEINKKIIFSIVVTPKKREDDDRYHDIYIFFNKIVLDANLTHNLVISSSALQINQKKMYLNDVDECSKRWMCERYIKQEMINDVQRFFSKWYMMDITLSIETSGPKYLFKTLHTDEMMTDFELLCDDGSVKVHRAILAEASPVLYTMLTGDWKESKEERITISGITQTTLQDFKNYIYLNTLPDNNLEPLMLLASLYMMPELEHKCGEKMLEDLSAENACKILQYALSNDLKMLGLNVLKCIKKGFIDVDEISESVLPSPPSPSTMDIIEHHFQYTVDHIDTITEPTFAPSITCNGLVWNFYVKVDIKDNRKELGIYISCNGIKDVAYWMCACEYEMKLLNHLYDHYNLFVKDDHVFHATDTECEFFPDIAWHDLVNPSGGYIEAHRINIDVRVVIAVPNIIQKNEDSEV